MTNTIALWLGVVLAAAVLGDVVLNEAAATIFVARKFMDVVEWVAFWR